MAGESDKEVTMVKGYFRFDWHFIKVRFNIYLYNGESSAHTQGWCRDSPEKSEWMKIVSGET